MLQHLETLWQIKKYEYDEYVFEIDENIIDDIIIPGRCEGSQIQLLESRVRKKYSTQYSKNGECFFGVHDLEDTAAINRSIFPFILIIMLCIMCLLNCYCLLPRDCANYMFRWWLARDWDKSLCVCSSKLIFCISDLISIRL